MTGSARILSALAYSLCQGLADPEEPRLGPPYNDVARFIDEQVGRMPAFSRLGVRGLTCLFDLTAWPVAGSAFHRLQHEERLVRIQAWRASRWSLCRQFLRLAESLAAYRLYARLDAPGR